MPDSVNRLPVEALAAEYLERLREGQPVDIEDYVDRHPELSVEIRELFPTVEALENLKRSRLRRPGPALRRLGDFCILSEIGRGGMGIVYEAVQESLGRHVALKVLPKQAVIDEKRLRRFQREARTAARLHHSNIVPVLGVGEEDGHRFIVMQYIRGVGLDEIVAQLRGDKAPHESPRRGRAQQLAASLRRQPLLHHGPSAQGSSSDVLMGAAARDRAVIDRAAIDKAAIDKAAIDKATIDKATCKAAIDETAIYQAAPLPNAARTLFGPSGPSGPAAQGDTKSSLPGGLDAAGGAGLGDGSLPKIYWQNVARLGMQAAAALAYAHEIGTLHRDIKPANLLLDHHGVLWVADFGLATAFEHDNVSQSGDIVGTLRYSSPEQLLGDADQRSDVFSLGLSLYELLTLRPALPDRRAHELAPLTPPRKLNPNVPRDLETIILKAAAPDRRHRYDSAHELAADLQAYVEDRPIQARRVPAHERAWRWCRRNRALSLASAAAAALLVTVAVVATAGYLETKRAYELERAALVGEQHQREKAESTLEITTRALDRLFRRFVPDRLMDGEELADTSRLLQPPRAIPVSPESAALLEEMLRSLDELAEPNEESQALAEVSARANRRMGDLRRRLGDYPQAIAAYEAAIVKFQRSESRWSADYSLEIARSFNELGGVRRVQGLRGQARQCYQEALRRLGLPGADAPAARRYEVARSVYLLASLTRSSSQEAPSISGAMRLLEGLISEDPDQGDYRHLLALFLLEAAPRDSERAKEAVMMLEQLVSEYADEPDYRYDLIVAYSRGAATLPGGPEGYLQRLRRALTHSEQLLAEHGQVREYLRTHLRVVHLLSRQLGRRPEAPLQIESEQLLRAAVARLETLTSRLPADAEFRFWLANTEDMLAARLLAGGQLEKARRHAEQSIARLYSLPPSTSNHSMLAASFETLSRIHAAAERRGDAADAADNAAYHRGQFKKNR